MLFECSIPGRPIVKKNTKKTVRRHGITSVIYSPQFIEWEKTALLILKSKWRQEPISGLIRAEFEFYFVNHMAEPDTSNLIEGPQDALTKAGVIADDKYLYHVSGEKFFGGDEFTIIRLFEYKAK